MKRTARRAAAASQRNGAQVTSGPCARPEAVADLPPVDRAAAARSGRAGRPLRILAAGPRHRRAVVGAARGALILALAGGPRRRACRNGAAGPRAGRRIASTSGPVASAIAAEPIDAELAGALAMIEAPRAVWPGRVAKPSRPGRDVADDDLPAADRHGGGGVADLLQDALEERRDPAVDAGTSRLSLRSMITSAPLASGAEEQRARVGGRMVAPVAAGAGGVTVALASAVAVLASAEVALASAAARRVAGQHHHLGFGRAPGRRTRSTVSPVGATTRRLVVVDELQPARARPASARVATAATPAVVVRRGIKRLRLVALAVVAGEPVGVQSLHQPHRRLAGMALEGFGFRGL